MAIVPYVTVAEMRAEGVTTAMASDSKITSAVALAQEYFEFQTHLFFNLQTNLTIRLDGNGTPILELPAPAQAITSVTVDGQSVTEIVDPSSLPSTGEFVNYNSREEDDYWFPRLEMYGGLPTRLERAFYYGSSMPYTITNTRSIWPWGKKNILIVGDFGFVEADGTTPLLVKQAVMRLAIQKLKPLATVNPLGGFFQSETLGSYSYSVSADVKLGGFSNDSVINEIITNYTRLPLMRSV